MQIINDHTMRGLILLFLIFAGLSISAQVAINTDGSLPDNSSILDVKSTTQGILIPRMTTAQRISIVTPAEGLMVYDLTTRSYWFMKSGIWEELADKSSSPWQVNGSSLYYAAGNVGIGDASPAATLTVGSGDKFQVSGTDGDVTFKDDEGSIIFPATADTNSPMIYMFAGNTSNYNRMVLAHSPSFRNWGLMYEDSFDKFHFVANGVKGVTVYPTGKIGINTTSPAYSLDVNGTARITGDVTLTNMYCFDADLSYGSISFASIANAYVEDANVTNSLSVTGSMEFENDAVVSSNSATPLEIRRGSAGLTVTNLAVGAFLDANYFFTAFADNPSISVGNLITGTGEWYKVQIIPYEITPSSCKLRVYNNSSDSVTMTGTWSLLLVGAK